MQGIELHIQIINKFGPNKNKDRNHIVVVLHICKSHQDVFTPTETSPVVGVKSTTL